MKNFFKDRSINLIISVTCGVLFFVIFSKLGQYSGNNDKVPAIIRVWGGHGGVGFIKILAYVAFIYGMLDLYGKRLALKREEQGFYLGLLPTQDQLRLTFEQVNEINMTVISRERNGEPRYLVASLIKKAATQFRNENSVGDTLRVLEMHIESYKNDDDGRLEEVRYIIQTVPMLGFIGTIIELTGALTLVREIEKVQAAMYSAFDATLVALALTIVLTWSYHTFVGKTDIFYAKAKSYITDNLISRIYDVKKG